MADMEELQRISVNDHIGDLLREGSSLRAERLGAVPAHHHDGAGTVGDLRRRAGGDGAVLGERRAQTAERLGGRARPYALVGREDHGLAAPLP